MCVCVCVFVCLRVCECQYSYPSWARYLSSNPVPIFNQLMGFFVARPLGFADSLDLLFPKPFSPFSLIPQTSHKYSQAITAFCCNIADISSLDGKNAKIAKRIFHSVLFLKNTYGRSGFFSSSWCCCCCRRSCCCCYRGRLLLLLSLLLVVLLFFLLLLLLLLMV